MIETLSPVRPEGSLRRLPETSHAAVVLYGRHHGKLEEVVEFTAEGLRPEDIAKRYTKNHFWGDHFFAFRMARVFGRPSADKPMGLNRLPRGEDYTRYFINGEAFSLKQAKDEVIKLEAQEAKEKELRELKAAIGEIGDCCGLDDGLIRVLGSWHVRHPGDEIVEVRDSKQLSSNPGNLASSVL